jgi:Tfp pilus assembly protein PilF
MLLALLQFKRAAAAGSDGAAKEAARAAARGYLQKAIAIDPDFDKAKARLAKLEKENK